MLLSMTGYGEGRGQTEKLNIVIEVKSVNNRHLKVSSRLPEACTALEPVIERIVKEFISRGTVSLFVRIQRERAAVASSIDEQLLKRYHAQLTAFATAEGLAAPTDLTAYLALPGVVNEDEQTLNPETDRELLEQVLRAALAQHRQFRETEGHCMQQELVSLYESVSDYMERIATAAPQVVTDHRDRLLQRVNQLLESSDVELDANDILREVSLFADRCDITEELTRLKSHLQQVQTIMQADQSQGRRLEFLGQEMFREVNTIGAKANNVSIAHDVVEMKAAIEKMREILANVE